MASENQKLIDLEAIRVANEALIVAQKTEARHDSHEKHCAERYAGIQKAIESMAQNQADAKVASSSSTAAIHTKMDDGFRAQNKLILTVAGTIILFLLGSAVSVGIAIITTIGSAG